MTITDQHPDEEDEEDVGTPRPRIRPRFSLSSGSPMPGAWRRHPQRGTTPRPGRLTEWHALDAAARGAAWKDLCAWVTWLHDRYELGVEERLPHCWAEHPGLIEELWALKAWRDEIYRAAQPSGQAARYWHAEMRQTINAAITFYAAGCRAGHQGASNPAATDPERQHRWAQADPATGIPQEMLMPEPTPRTDSHLFLTTATMGARRLDGTAHQLSATIHDIVQHDGSWWTTGDGGWLRITDDTINQQLTRRAKNLARADASVEQHTTHQSQSSTEPHGRPR